MDEYIQFMTSKLDLKVEESIILKNWDNNSDRCVYKIFMDNEYFIVKFSKTTESRIKNIHTFILNADTLPIIAPIVISGKTYQAFKNTYFEIYPYILHDEFGEFPLQPITFISIIKIISKLHCNEIEDFMFEKCFARSEELFNLKLDTLVLIQKFIYQGIGIFIMNKCYEFFTRKNFVLLEKKIIHGDIHFKNFLYTNSRATKIIDFDRCCVDSIYFDLAYALFYCCFFNKDIKIQNCNIDLFNYLVNKYQKYRSIAIDYTILYVYIISIIIKYDIDFIERYGIIESFCMCQLTRTC